MSQPLEIPKNSTKSCRTQIISILCLGETHWLIERQMDSNVPLKSSFKFWRISYLPMNSSWSFMVGSSLFGRHFHFLNGNLHQCQRKAHSLSLRRKLNYFVFGTCELCSRETPDITCVWEWLRTVVSLWGLVLKWQRRFWAGRFVAASSVWMCNLQISQSFPSIWQWRETRCREETTSYLNEVTLAARNIRRKIKYVWALNLA